MKRREKRRDKGVMRRGREKGGEGQGRGQNTAQRGCMVRFKGETGRYKVLVHVHAIIEGIEASGI